MTRNMRLETHLSCDCGLRSRARRSEAFPTEISEPSVKVLVNISEPGRNGTGPGRGSETRASGLDGHDLF